MEKEVPHLQDPDQLTLTDTYRSLPRNGEINVFTTPGNLVYTLHMMELSGFVGMEIIFLNPSAESASIRAYKAKSGPCYETGRYITYEGAALAALDDDNHILFAGERTKVCEKTANVYQLPAYENIVSISKADPVLLEKLMDEPVPFNCDTWEADHIKLSGIINETKSDTREVELIYPGPFRLLIMHDGRIIYRGQANAIPLPDSTDLIRKDRLFREESERSANPVFFNDIYRLNGTACLLEKPVLSQKTETELITDFESLEKITPELKGHLLNLISENKKYFILTGSDTNDKFGCCPSDIVTEANRLQKAGILDSFRQPSPGESCSLTIYAFKNEIKVEKGEPQFTTDNKFRQTVAGILKDTKPDNFRKYIKWVLFAFIGISLAFAVFKLLRSSVSPQEKTLFEQLAPVSGNQSVIVLFHFRERCSLCLKMEEYTTDVINSYYTELIRSGTLRFDLLTIDDPDNKGLVERFGITSATLVLVTFESNKEKDSFVLKDMWEYAQEETVFKAELRKQLEIYLED